MLGFARNLVATTLGNIVGGAFFVAVLYWMVSRPAAAPVKETQDDLSGARAVPT